MGTLEDNQTMYRDLGSLLANWGWPVEFYDDWETRTNGNTVRVPTAITLHHTGGEQTDTDYLVDPPDRPELVVLANVHITRDHKIKILAAGSTSHAGYNYEPNYHVIADGDAPLDRELVPGSDSSTFSANTYTVGVEVDGAGGIDEWDYWMHHAVLAFCLAFHYIMPAWADSGTNPRIGSHKELTKRKPGDPYVNLGDVRTAIATALDNYLAFVPPGDANTGPKPVDSDFRFGQWNTQLEHFGGPDDGSPVRGDFLAEVMKCSVYALSECNETQRNAIRAINTNLKVYAYKTVCVMWDANKWDYRKITDADEVDFGGTSYHGALRVELTRKDNGRKVDVISIHVRPSDAFDGMTDDEIVDAKQGDIREALDKLVVNGHTTIFAGDFSTSTAEDVLLPAGFVRATPNVDTMDKGGDQRVDAVFITPDLVHRDEDLLDPGSASDHKAWVYQGTLKG